MSKRYIDIDPMEFSFGESPKNRRRLLVMKDGAPLVEPPASGTVNIGGLPDTSNLPAAPAVTDPPATPPVTQAATETAPVAPVIDNPTVPAAELAQKAYEVAARRSLVIPKGVREAVRTIVSRAGLTPGEVNKALDEESQVHLKSLVGLIPDDAPAEIKAAAAVLKDWGDAGFAMTDMEGMMPEMPTMAPPKRRVVRAENLISAAEDMAAQMMEEGMMDMAKEVMGFRDSCRKALPEGGLVVVSGVVPNDGSIPMKNLSEIWQSENPAATQAIQAVVERCSMPMGYSQAQKALEEMVESLDAFGKDVMKIASSELGREAKLAQIQQSFTQLGTKLPELIEKTSPPDVKDQLGQVLEVLQSQLAPIVERLDRVEKGQQKLSFGPAPELPRAPVQKSLRHVPGPVPRDKETLSVAELVEASAKRRFGQSL